MKHKEVFERLEPPPGGLAKLRERIVQPSERRHFLPLAGAIAAAAALILVWSSGRAPDLVGAARQRGGLEEVALGLAPSPGPTAAVQEQRTSALAEVPTSNPSVAFYWVGSTTWAD